MSLVTFTEPGELGITFQSGELVEVVEVKPGSACAQAGVQAGWLIERVNDAPMHRRSRSFEDVAAALKDPGRPLRIQFALQSVGVKRLASVGGGWLFDIPVTLPGGRSDIVSVSQQDSVENAGDLKRLLLEQHGVAHLPIHAVQLILVRQLCDGGLRGSTWTGEKEETVRNNMAIDTVRKRLDGRFETLAACVEAPHVWSPKPADRLCKHDSHAAGQPLAACGTGAGAGKAGGSHEVSSATSADDDAFELEFEDNVIFGA